MPSEESGGCPWARFTFSTLPITSEIRSGASSIEPATLNENNAEPPSSEMIGPWRTHPERLSSGSVVVVESP